MFHNLNIAHPQRYSRIYTIAPPPYLRKKSVRKGYEEETFAKRLGAPYFSSGAKYSKWIFKIDIWGSVRVPVTFL